LINPGWNSIHIKLEEIREAPEKRQMELDKVSSVGIFAKSLPQPRNILIDDVKLF
jgi:hypothetical protein